MRLLAIILLLLFFFVIEGKSQDTDTLAASQGAPPRVLENDFFQSLSLRNNYKNVSSLTKPQSLDLKLNNINKDNLTGKKVYLSLADSLKDVPPKISSYKLYESKTHLLTSLIEVALVEYIPFAMAKYLRDWESTEEENWTKVSFDSWRRNLRDGFEYDADNFLTNYFAHPYHGNLYYNAGRTNGYNFWESSIYAFIGSGVWEMFAETFRPSFNDLVNTTVNGINFGETLFRLSAMVTDNRSSGFERVWREAVGGIINPVRGVNRLISGETFRKFDNPDYCYPEKFLVKFSAGVRRLDNSQEASGDIFSKGKEQGLYSMDVIYGDPFETPDPFSYLNFGIELTTGAPQLANMYSRGNLFGITLQEKKAAKHKINFMLDYSYTNNPGFQYGQTSIIPSLMSVYDFIGSTKLITNVGINAVLMGGTNTDYFIGEDGRDYDLGPGIGMMGDFKIVKGNWTFVELFYTNGWIFSMTEPQESTHNLNYVSLNLYLPLQKYFAVGFSASIFWRESVYKDSPDVNRQVPIAKLFFSTTL